MKRDSERAGRTTQMLVDLGLDAFICALPVNVLMLSGYWPVVGSSFCIALRDGQTTLLVPEDEASLANDGWADEIVTYETGSLDELKCTADQLLVELAKIAAKTN